MDIQRNMPLLNVFYILSKQKVFQLLFFEECTVTGIRYPRPGIGTHHAYFEEENPDDMQFQLECLHHSTNYRLTEQQVSREMGWLSTWPSHPSDLTCIHFSLWQYIKDTVYMPWLTSTFLELAGRINSAAATVPLNTLNNMWTELSLLSSCLISLCGIIIWKSTQRSPNTPTLLYNICLLFCTCYVFRFSRIIIWQFSWYSSHWIMSYSGPILVTVLT